ncbi:MAG TPA: zf-HC2 domain-containing protein, partial [Solirubrobacter sp.]|nr:zf-HC2 domain-containing protein [Solirubrobacter sp.]
VTAPIVPGGISCREVVELVTAYIENALTPDELARFEAHLELCPPCVEYVDQVRTTARLAAVATAELELRPDRAALLTAFRDFKRGS